MSPAPGCGVPLDGAVEPVEVGSPEDESAGEWAASEESAGEWAAEEASAASASRSQGAAPVTASRTVARFNSQDHDNPPAVAKSGPATASGRSASSCPSPSARLAIRSTSLALQSPFAFDYVSECL